MTYFKALLVLLLLSLLTAHVGFGQDHLDGAFEVDNFTWVGDSDHDLDIDFEYDPSNAPSSTPASSTIYTLAHIAFDVWNSATSKDRIHFDSVSPFVPNQLPVGEANDGRNVILWDDVVGGDAFTHHYPPGANGGYESERSADIIFDVGTSFLYGSSPPSSRSSSAKDWVETLIHELGHVHGLQHTSQDIHVMHVPYEDRSSSLPLRTLSNGDKAGALYQHPKAELQGSLPDIPLAFTAREDDITITGDLTIQNRLDFEEGTLVVPSSSTTITIEESDADVTMGNGATIQGGKLVIKSGGTLTVEDGALIDNSEITVDNGGTLIAEGGTIQRSDIDVENGGTLQTSGNPTFKFESSTGIKSYGLLEIDGGTFEKYGSANWLFIYPSGSGADGSSIEGATINGASYGIHTYNIDGLTIDDVTVTNSDNHGLKVYSSQSVTVENSVFEESGSSGAYIDGSDVVILDSRFESNGADGVRVRGASNADFGLQNSDHPSVLSDNLRGLNAYNSSYATLGDMTVNGNNFGKSSCYDNTYNARTADSGVILAEETWWGSNPPNTSLFDEGGGVIIYGDWLTSPVVTRMDAAPVFAQPGVLSDVTTGVALQRAEVNVPAPAATSLPGDNLSELAPAEFVRRMRRLLSQDAGAAAALIDQVRRGPASRNQRLATLFSVQHQAREGRLAAAEAIAKTVLDASDLAVWERAFILKQLFYAHLNAGHYAEASQLLSTLTALDEDDAKSGLLAAVFEEVAGQKPVLKQDVSAAPDEANQMLTTTPTIETENYPNPFNPTTTIRYTLPEAAFVTLRVFDMLGREVVELVHAKQLAGAHQATFDASGLPSGLYVYRLDVGGHTLHGEMLLSNRGIK